MADRQRVDPYGFVPLGPVPPIRERVTDGHDRLHAHRRHGALTCRLTLKTPLFIAYDPEARREANGREVLRFPVSQGEAVIPGSSLKGVIRSLFEAIVPSCFVLPDDWEHPGTRTYRGSGLTRGTDVTVRLPDPGFMRCADTVNLCPACRVFGSVGANDGAWAGRVAISEARARPGQFEIMNAITLGVLATPKPEMRRKEYVVGPDNVVRGRKFYRHRFDRVQGDPRNRQTRTVEPVAADAVFTFTVQYENLTPEDLRPLLYALALEDGLWHKLGMGKPIGLGSAHIEIVEWHRLDPQARYRGRGSGMEILTGDPLGRALDDEVAGYRRTARQPDEPENLKALRDILRARHDFDVNYAPARPQTGPPPGRPRAPQAAPPLRTEWRRSRR